MSDNDQDENAVAATAARFEGSHQSAAGDKMHVKAVLVPAKAVEVTHNFDEDFGGALLSVQIIHGDLSYLPGTAFMVMPGLAITASHVFDDFKDLLISGRAQIFLLGRQGSNLLPWAVAQIRYSQDVALLEVEPKFELGSSFSLFHFDLTARLPTVGEPVLALGLIALRQEFHLTSSLSVEGIVSPGAVIDWQEYSGYGRGVTVVCDFFGPHGMSGGPIFDAAGHVFGILSSAIGKNVTDEFTCYCVAPWPAFIQTIQPHWPEGLYAEASLWPGHVHEAWRLGIGNDEAGNRVVTYYDD